MELVTREKLREQLNGLGIDFSDRMLQHALKGLDFKPAKFEGVSGGKGRIALHDPIDAWVIATAHYSKIAWTSNEVRLDVVAPTYDLVRNLDEAKYIPQFLEDRVFGMKLLYIASWNRGIPYSVLHDLLDANPAALDLCTQGRQFMVIVFMGYKMVLGDTLKMQPLPGTPHYEDAKEFDMSTFFAERWVEWTGGVFRQTAITTAINEGLIPEPEVPEGYR